MESHDSQYSTPRHISPPTPYFYAYNWFQVGPATMATFVVSGLMHEILYYYVTRASPTWEVTSFFLLHGICLIIEVAAKRTLADRWRLHRVVSGPLVVAFVVATIIWLFWPQLLRNGVIERMIEENFTFANFVTQKVILNLVQYF